MNLSEYDAPDRPMAEEFAPDPRASQKLAARKRQQPVADVPASTAPRLRARQQQTIVGIVGVLSVIGVLALAIGQHGGLQQPRPLATPAQAFSTAAPPQASPALFAAPLASDPTPTMAEPQIDAYAAPDGALLGPVELSRASRAVPLAHCGNDAILVDVDGSGQVWFRTADIQLAIVGEDVCRPAMTGRGNGPAPAWAPPPPAPVAEPSYRENVGQQAPHCVRTCDGRPGPAGGEYVIVPTLQPAQLEVIGAQAPHKVR